MHATIEYAVTLEIRKWTLFWPVRQTETFIVDAASAHEAVALAKSGLVSGMEKHREYWEGEEDQESTFDIRVLNIHRI